MRITGWGAVILMLLLWAGTISADSGDVFHNPTVGLTVTKPSGWHYVTAARNRENIDQIHLTDKEFHAAMKEYAQAPLVAMAKHPEPFDDLNPSFKVNLKPFGQLKGTPPGRIIRLVVPQFENVFKDFEMVQPPTEVTVSGIESAYARMDYTMELPDGRSFPTTSGLWIVPHGDYFFMIGAGTRQDEATGSRAEIQEILKTLDIERISTD
ncbi:hypothetical protein [Marinobacter sp. OP 3.4]|uniref:hypothetical protein n=1 Tax=Marinobacter sp. OP 3.4 TaxID=3076501 RepID=UPI002E243730